MLYTKRTGTRSHASPFRMDIFEERNTALLLHTLYGGGFGAQILAQVALGKLRIAGQRQVEAFDLVDLQCQVIGGQAQNVAALGLVAAAVVEVPARQVDAVHIPGTLDGDNGAVGVGEVELPLVLGHLRQGGIGLLAGKAAADVHGLELAGGLDHVKDVLVALHIRC